MLGHPKSKVILIGILLLAAGLRLWNLGNIPPHLTPDEASLGYNAYSILKTGKDESFAYYVQKKIAEEGVEGQVFLSSALTYAKEIYKR